MDIRKVMLVDDEPDIRTIGQMSLETLGRWEVVLAASGEEAVALGARERPDLILLDVMMPDMDGPTTLNALRRQPGLDGVPVVFLTAKVQKAEVDRYRDLGAVAVIPKPFDPMTLPDQLRRIAARA